MQNYPRNRGVDDRFHERALFLGESEFRTELWRLAQDHKKADCGCYYEENTDELIFCTEEHQAKR